MAGGDTAGAGGDGGEGRAPPASRDPEKPPGGKLFFFPVESRALMLRHTNPGCWGGVREVAGLQPDAGKLYSQRSCSNEKMNETSYGVDLVLKYEQQGKGREITPNKPQTPMSLKDALCKHTAFTLRRKQRSSRCPFRAAINLVSANQKQSPQLY